ncbi:hypothetical protein DYZ55_02319 [Listeria monocytogenes]|nr:hypothetical protein [Listeria monocytogenes]EAC6059984.1 hypothetical protein [Listeria monocytogenes]EAC7008342.1 hypothetical protein [Listeria monocytogenes]EAC8234975.1 hypothetical protein [Listeria monocytogenes]EAC8237186.1 hypothetical protein [Listeria monocytogenes]
MIISTKITPIHKSLIYKALLLLSNESHNLSYKSNHEKFNSIIEYIDVMTILFALGYIESENLEVTNNDPFS